MVLNEMKESYVAEGEKMNTKRGKKSLVRSFVKMTAMFIGFFLIVICLFVFEILMNQEEKMNYTDNEKIVYIYQESELGPQSEALDSQIQRDGKIKKVEPVAPVDVIDTVP